MNDADLKKRMSDLVDGVIKLRLMTLLPDEFLAFISHAETHVNPENFAKLESFYSELAKYLQARADNYQPTAPQPAQPAQSEPRLEHFAVPNNLIN